MASRVLRRKRLTSTQGYTLVEVLVVVIIVTILAVLASLSLSGWVNRLRVNSANDIIFNVIREAQSIAEQRKITWQASFRQSINNPDLMVEWSSHQAGSQPTIWQTIYQPGVIINLDHTTLYKQNTINAWRIQFNHKGHPNGQLGRLTLSNKNGENKRCVFVSTLIGALRTAEDKRCEK